MRTMLKTERIETAAMNISYPKSSSSLRLNWNITIHHNRNEARMV